MQSYNKNMNYFIKNGDYFIYLRFLHINCYLFHKQLVNLSTCIVFN